MIVWLGHLITRLPMAAQWLRAVRSATGAERTMALRYAGGVLLCMVGRLGLVLLPGSARPWLFLVMALAEPAVPVYAEKSFATSWHPHHISERYGLFTIIVLSEAIAADGPLIVFSAWGIYFAVPIHIHGHLRTNRQALLWGYGRYLIFASVAAIRAGLEVAVEQVVGKARISTLSASAAVTLPTALHLLAVRALHSCHFKVGTAQQLVLPATALPVIMCTFPGDWGCSRRASCRRSRWRPG